MSIQSAIFRRHPLPPNPPKPQPKSVPLSAWFENQLWTVGCARVELDQFPGQAFTANVSTEHRYVFTLPPETNFLWGAWLIIAATEDTAEYRERCIIGQIIDGRNVWQIQDIAIQPLTPPVKPFQPCPREYRGNMCGVHIPGLPPIPGGANDPTLLLSWFLDRYPQEWRATAYETYRNIGVRDVLVSWPDARANGMAPDQFGAFCQEVVTAGFQPCVMLASKYYDPPDLPGLQRNISPVLPYLTNVVPRFGAAWEASLWMQPVQLDALVDWLAPLINPWGGKLYIHLQAGYASFDIDGPRATFAGYWNRQVGKLTGILHQRELKWDKAL